MTITAAQIRAARQLLGVSQADIAEKTGFAIVTIKRAESEREVSVSDDVVSAIQKALEQAGVVFLDDGAMASGGEGVRLKKQRTRR